MEFQILTDEKWQMISSMFPHVEKRGRGKPHTPWRAVMNSILYVLQTKSKWEALPKSADFSSKSAAHRWYKVWKANGLLEEILKKLKDEGGLSIEMTFPSSRNRLPKVQVEEEPS
jgi:transposase